MRKAVKKPPHYDWLQGRPLDTFLAEGNEGVACSEGTAEIAYPANTPTPSAQIHGFSLVRKLHWQQQCYPCNPRCREVCGVTPEVRLHWWGFDTVLPGCGHSPSHSLLTSVASPSEIFLLFSAGFSWSPEWVICYLLCQVGNEYLTTSRWHKQKEREKNTAMKSIVYLMWRH